MGHSPDCLVVFDIQFSLHLGNGNPGLRCSHPVDQPKPLEQRRLGLVENGACSHRRLITTCAAQTKTAFLQKSVFRMAASRATETLRPPCVKKPFPALLLRTKLLLKLQKIHTFVDRFVQLYMHARRLSWLLSRVNRRFINY